MTLREFIHAVNPKYQFYRHVDRLIDILEQVELGTIRRLMIFMPPRHGKSELVSRLFSAYYLYRHPERWVGITSYGADLAFTLSRAARDNYGAGGDGARRDAAAVNHWETGQGGGMWAAGVSGPITGKGFHLGIIDDPLKDAEEASSETIRAKQKDWYASTFYTREEPGGAIIVIQTRWHEDDLSGWLLAQEELEEPECWHIVNYAAIRGDDPQAPASCTLEPDWREPGQALCPERYPLSRLTAIEKRVGSYFWHALFQQRPGPREGSFFRRGWFQIVDAVPAGARRVRYWDKAGTEGGGDYSAGVLIAKSEEGLFYVVDVVRGQWSPGERNRIMRQTAELDGRGVALWLEQEPGSGGKESAQLSIRDLAGFTVRAEPVTGDKASRAGPFAAQCEAGNVRVLRGTWNTAYLEELSAFPNGRHDDQVDASAGAFNKLATNYSKPGTAKYA